ncbi:MAG: hypothetical protein OHK006_15020 [Thermodesulfovibrionales bacterium]
MPARLAAFALAVLALCSPATASETITLTFDRSGERLPGVPSAFLARSEPFATPEGVRQRSDVRYDSYSVFGRSFGEIMKSVDENGVRSAGRQKRTPSAFDWVTGLSFTYDYTYEIAEDDDMAVVALEVIELKRQDRFRITLPHLVNDTALNPIELSLFQDFSAKLLEQEHRRMEVVRDEEIWNALRDGILRLQVFKVTLVEGMDIERTIESIITQEAVRLGRERARRVQERMKDFEQKAAPPGHPAGR